MLEGMEVEESRDACLDGVKYRWAIIYTIWMRIPAEILLSVHR